MNYAMHPHKGSMSPHIYNGTLDTHVHSLSIHTYIHKGSLFMVGCVQHPTAHRESKIGDKLECSNYPFIHYIHVTLL